MAMMIINDITECYVLNMAMNVPIYITNMNGDDFGLSILTIFTIIFKFFNR